MMNDLDAVAVRIPEIARAGSVAMGTGLRLERYAAAFQKGGPPIHVRRRAHDQAEMIER